jgi:prevent-host-death family protein
MTVTTISSREFNQDVGRAKKAAVHGPVIITDRGKPAHVLMTIEAYERISGGGDSIVELLAMPGAEDIAFEPGKLSNLSRPADLS